MNDRNPEANSRKYEEEEGKQVQGLIRPAQPPRFPHRKCTPNNTTIQERKGIYHFT